MPSEALHLVGEDDLAKEWTLILVPREGLNEPFYCFLSIWKCVGNITSLAGRAACISLPVLERQRQVVETSLSGGQGVRREEAHSSRPGGHRAPSCCLQTRARIHKELGCHKARGPQSVISQAGRPGSHLSHPSSSGHFTHWALRTINKDPCEELFFLTFSPEIKIKLGECNPDSSLLRGPPFPYLLTGACQTSRLPLISL